jgi:hypothetical protein
MVARQFTAGFRDRTRPHPVGMADPHECASPLKRTSFTESFWYSGKIWDRGQPSLRDGPRLRPMTRQKTAGLRPAVPPGHS